MWPRYREAGRKEKGWLLDKVCRVTGYHRKYAVRCLNGPPPDSRPRRRRLRVAQYGKAVDKALRVVWEAANYPWSMRLKALLPRWLPWLKERPSISPRLESQLLRISPCQIDRRLKPYKVRAKKRLYGRTKPGTLLEHHIPIKAERWEVAEPGDLGPHFCSPKNLRLAKQEKDGRAVRSIGKTARRPASRGVAGEGGPGKAVLGKRNGSSKARRRDPPSPIGDEGE